MLSNIIAGILTAWFLTIFDFDVAVIRTFAQFGFKIDVSTYYVLFALIGAITNFTDQKVRGREK